MKLAFVLLAGAATAMASNAHREAKRVHRATFVNRRNATEAIEKRQEQFHGTATWYDGKPFLAFCFARYIVD